MIVPLQQYSKMLFHASIDKTFCNLIKQICEFPYCLFSPKIKLDSVFALIWVGVANQISVRDDKSSLAPCLTFVFHECSPILYTVDGLNIVGYQFSWFLWRVNPRMPVPTKWWFSVWIMKENTMATIFNPINVLFLFSPRNWYQRK